VEGLGGGTEESIEASSGGRRDEGRDPESPCGEAESIIELYKTELVRHEGPWKGMEDLELATLSWVWWFNNKRLFGPIGHVPPIEYEAAFYAGSGDNITEPALTETCLR
jgi:transposase InsO family protein